MLFFYNKFIDNFTFLRYRIIRGAEKFSLLHFNFVKLNNLLWQEGFYVDFIQKKIADKWTKNFLVISAYIFSEKIVFEILVKFFLVNIIRPFHKFSIFDVSSVSFLIFVVLFFLINFYLLYFFSYIFLVVF